VNTYARVRLYEEGRGDFIDAAELSDDALASEKFGRKRQYESNHRSTAVQLLRELGEALRNGLVFFENGHITSGAPGNDDGDRAGRGCERGCR